MKSIMCTIIILASTLAFAADNSFNDCIDALNKWGNPALQGNVVSLSKDGKTIALKSSDNKSNTIIYTPKASVSIDPSGHCEKPNAIDSATILASLINPYGPYSYITTGDKYDKVLKICLQNEQLNKIYQSLPKYSSGGIYPGAYPAYGSGIPMYPGVGNPKGSYPTPTPAPSNGAPVNPNPGVN